MSPLSTRTPNASSRPDRRARHRKRIATAATVMMTGRLVDAVAVDVSSGGLKLVSSTALTVGARIEVALILEGEVLDVVARVCWVADHGALHHAAGLAFEGLDVESRAHLAALCGDRPS